LVGFGYFGVNYVIEEIQNVLVGNINIDHDLLVVEFVEREEGKLTLSNRIEIYDEKHTLAYTYNVRLMDFMTIEDSQLLVTTDSEQIVVVSYDSILLTTTNQAVDVVIALNTEYEFSPGEQLTFTLTFGLENYFPTIQQTPEKIIVEPTVYNMEFGYIGNNQTLTDGNLSLTNVNLMGNYIEMTGSLKSVLELTVNKGTVELQLGLSGSQSNMQIFTNEIYTTEFKQWHDGVINLTIEEDNTIIKIITTSTNRGFVTQITYTPE